MKLVNARNFANAAAITAYLAAASNLKRRILLFGDPAGSAAFAGTVTDANTGVVKVLPGGFVVGTGAMFDLEMAPGQTYTPTTLAAFEAAINDTATKVSAFEGE